jgi:hypothetical protein
MAGGGKRLSIGDRGLDQEQEVLRYDECFVSGLGRRRGLRGTLRGILRSTSDGSMIRRQGMDSLMIGMRRLCLVILAGLILCC